MAPAVMAVAVTRTGSPSSVAASKPCPIMSPGRIPSLEEALSHGEDPSLPEEKSSRTSAL
jgi:hypothetical protein